MQRTCLYSIWIDDEAIFKVDEIKVHCTSMHMYMYLYIDNKLLHAVLNVCVYTCTVCVTYFECNILKIRTNFMITGICY